MSLRSAEFSCKTFSIKSGKCQGGSQGGGDMGVRTPPIGPNFLVIFIKILTKRQMGTYLQRFKQGVQDSTSSGDFKHFFYNSWIMTAFDRHPWSSHTSQSKLHQDLSTDWQVSWPSCEKQQ